MIDPKRASQAYNEGVMSAIATKCNPQRAECRYNLHSAQHRAFNEGWNSIYKPFRKILTPAHKAIKYSE